MKRVYKKVYITADDQEFTNKAEAEKHEKSLIGSTRKNAFPVVIYTNPDTTEGRYGPKTPVYGVVYAHRNASHVAKRFATLYAYRKYGAPVSFCMGVFGGNAIMKGWKVGTADWDDLPKKVDFVVVDSFIDPEQDLYPHENKFGESEFRKVTGDPPF